jgi:hypothetical protein
MSSRRNFIKQSSLIGLSGFINPIDTMTNFTNTYQSKQPTKWADGSKMVVSISMQFETGGQPDNAESPFPQNIQQGYIDLLLQPGTNMATKKAFQECWTIGISWV